MFKNKFIIAVEGIDGSGKTTQCVMLKKYLKERGIKARIIGRRFLVSTILACTPRKEIIIADRYTSTVSVYFRYKKIKNKFIWNLYNMFPKPDILFFLDLDVDSALKRIKERGKKLDKYECREGLSIFSFGYNLEFEQMKDVLYKFDSKINALQVHKQITKITLDKINIY